MMKAGRYVIISELGRGAMGIVYKASDPTIGREVALKVLTLSPSPGEGTNSPQEMFMREVRAAGRLAHPSIVTIYDAFDDEENQTSCIVMELVPGMTLEKILDSGHPLTIEQSLYLIRQVVEGLDYAHRNQVIHRDLKPANILVTQEGRAKITDFGIAKVLARESIVRTVGMMGTPSYMSPEQVKGGEIDGRTDIFSLGIIIFTMLSGKKPFTGNTAAVMFRIVYEEPVDPSSLNPRLTPAHDYVVKKCLAKDRNLRYASAHELLGDLDDLQHGRPPRSQVAAPPFDRTPSTPIPGVIAASPQPSPRPTPPKPLTAPPSSPSFGRTLPMPIPSLIKGMSQPPSPGVVSTPPASPPAPGQPPKPVIPLPVKPALPLDARPPTGKTPPTRVPDLSAAPPSVPASPPPTRRSAVSGEPTLRERTIPMPGPDRPAVSSRDTSLPWEEPLPPPPPDSPLMESTHAMAAADLSAVSPAGGPQPDTLAPPLQPDAAIPGEPGETSGAVSPASKSKLIPILVGGVAFVLLAAAVLGFWKFHQTRTASAPQVAVQTQPATPPPVTTPAEPPAPSAEAAPAEATTPVSAPPEVAKKPMVRKTKQEATPTPAAPAEAPPPAQPHPEAVTPAPQPPPSTPSPEDIAKAEAARLASIPRIIQVLCNYGLKEATFVFSTSGKPLFEETLKGKKKKGGFLGIKGSYEGTFSHTITVPAGVSEVSVRVIAKEGGTDLTKAIKMPPPGGFVPTLAVEVDSDHLSLNWKGPSAAK